MFPEIGIPELIVGGIVGGISDFLSSYGLWSFNANVELIHYGGPPEWNAGLFLSDVLIFLLFGGIMGLGMKGRNALLTSIGIGGFVYELGEEIRELTGAIIVGTPTGSLSYRPRLTMMGRK